MSEQEEGVEQTFDSEAHRGTAIDRYRAVEGQFRDFAKCLERILTDALEHEQIAIHSITSRAKEADSLGSKAALESEVNPGQPKYADPLVEITDLAGVRVITYFLDTVPKVCEVVETAFEVIERSDKSEQLLAEERLGYQSVHYLVRLDSTRAALPEYARFAGMIAEVQVRTILQHSWAEIEHDIKYKSASTLPASLRQRFLSLAGLLEIADREFQAIEKEHDRVTREAAAAIEVGDLEHVEITPESVKAYADKHFGPDLRQAAWSYRTAAYALRALGFTSLYQIEEATRPYDPDAISRLLWGFRQGQLNRLYETVMAAMGETYLERHPFRRETWFAEGVRRRLEKLRAAGIPVGTYVPLGSAQ